MLAAGSAGAARGTQPGQVESMRAIEAVLDGYLAGEPEAAAAAQHPHAAGFIRRAYDWLGPVAGLSELQTLLLRRALLPFDFFAKHNEDHQAAYADCFGEGGRGQALDAQLAALIGIPEHYLTNRRNYRENLDAIADPEKRTLYTICYHIADAVSELSDCHHSTFRRIERWIYAIGTLTWDGPADARPARRRRPFGRTLFGYALGLDRWLQGVPMQFLLLDHGSRRFGLRSQERNSARLRISWRRPQPGQAVAGRVSVVQPDVDASGKPLQMGLASQRFAGGCVGEEDQRSGVDGSTPAGCVGTALGIR